MNTLDRAALLHQRVPANWYSKVIKESFVHRFWHRARFREVEKSIEEVKDGKVLDIGCADGTFSRIILEKSRARLLVGIDVLERSITFAKRRFARSKKMSFCVADAHELPFQNKSFDAVYAMESIEHIERPKVVFAGIFRVLKDRGYVLILVPSENFLFKTLWFFWELLPGRIWKGTHVHTIKPKNIPGSLKKIGFKIDEERNILFGMLKLIKARK